MFKNFIWLRLLVGLSLILGSLIAPIVTSFVSGEQTAQAQNEPVCPKTPEPTETATSTPTKTPAPTCTIENLVFNGYVNLINDDAAGVQADATWDFGPDEIVIDFFGQGDRDYRKGDPAIPPFPGWEVPRQGEPYELTLRATAWENGEKCATTKAKVTIPAHPATPTPEPQPVWDSTFDCTVLKVSVLINETFGNDVLVKGWLHADGEELLYFEEVKSPAPDAWSNTMMDTPVNFSGEASGRIELYDNDSGVFIAEHDFSPVNLDCTTECVVDGLYGYLNYTGNHMSDLPVTGEVWNPSPESCEDIAYLHVFGSMDLEPEGPGWLESQEYVTSFTYVVPEGNNPIDIIASWDLSSHCYFQADLVTTPEIRVPPYYVPPEMVDYVFVEGTNPDCEPEPTPTPTEEPIPTDTPEPTPVEPTPVEPTPTGVATLVPSGSGPGSPPWQLFTIAIGIAFGLWGLYDLRRLRMQTIN